MRAPFRAGPGTALLVDAANTLLHLDERVGETYARIAAGHGLALDPHAVEARFRAAIRRTTARSSDGRSWWRRIVTAATGSADPALFDALYAYYANPEVWHLAPGALDAFDRLRATGCAVAIVSDWDERLRPLLGAKGVLDRVDVAAISCEVGFDKPDPRLFLAACDAVGVTPARALHVGDDPDRDAAGARAAGCHAWTWGADVHAFEVIAAALLA